MIEWKFTSSVPSPADLESARAAYDALLANPDAGFIQASQDFASWSHIATRAQQIQAQFSEVVVVGIGGSSLGAQALLGALGAHKMKVHFWDNLDPDTVTLRWSQLSDLSRVHWLWISKSGTTLEVLHYLKWVEQKYASQGLRLSSQSTCVAQPADAPLQKWAKSNDVETLPIAANVSGRYSVFTAAGLLAAACGGVDLEKVRRGVEAAARSRSIVESVAAECLLSVRSMHRVLLLWTYGDRLQPLAKWFQQLWAESLGKQHRTDGSAASLVAFPVVCAGSIDQHSILQQVMASGQDKWVWFIKSKSFSNQDLGPSSAPTFAQVFQAQGLGTEQALNEAHVMTSSLVFPSIDIEYVSKWMFIANMLVATVGVALKVHPFDQPGVERGKVITKELLG